MSNSSLISHTRLSPCCTSPRNHAIDSVAIHTMAGNLSVETCGELFHNPSTAASSNYGIGSDGRIALYVDESDRSWCTSSGGVDNRAITIEVASTSGSEPYECTSEAYESLIKLLVDICQRNNISGLTWKGDQTYAKAAAAGGPVDQQNMFVHRWFEQKSCPGEYLFSKQGDIANEVNKRLKNGISYQGTGPVNNIDTSQNTSQSTVTVNYQNFNPYIVTLDRNSKNIPYKKLKSAKVIGAMVEAGFLYTSQLTKVPSYENPKLKEQITNLSAQKLSWGMFTYVRARTVSQAREEMYQFSFPVRRYPPQFGVWLYLDLAKNKKLNSTILDKYIKELTDMGYVGAMGIMCEKSALNYIDWDKYQKDFFLYLIDHVKDTSEINKLMDPEFFDVEIKKNKKVII